MRVTRAEEYGVRLVMSLAVNGRQMTIRDLAGCEDLPQPTVAKVINRLRRAGVVSAVRGRYGGYTLARPADEISLSAIVDAFDKLADPSFCERMRSQGERCAREGSCELRPVWSGLASVISKHLAGISIADIISGRLVYGSAEAALYRSSMADNPLGSVGGVRGGGGGSVQGGQAVNLVEVSA